LDRNVIIATALIAVIMIGWLWLLAPEPGTQPSLQEAPIEDTLAAREQQLESAAAADSARQGFDPVRADSGVAGVVEGDARLITVDTDLYQAQFSTKGGTIVSFILKEYKQFDQETPVQLIDTTANGALSLAFTTPGAHLVDTRSLFFESDFEGDTLTLTDAAGSLTFETSVSGGVIRQTYTFIPGEYELGYAVVQENAAAVTSPQGYEVVWNGGIPFTEGDPETEAQAAGAYAKSGGEVESVLLTDDAYEEQRLAGNVTWTAVKNKYFTAVIMPSKPTRGAELIGERLGDGTTLNLWETYTTRVLLPQPQEGVADEFTLYVGPMEFYRITGYSAGLYDMVDYGWDFFEFMTRPLAKFIFIPVFTFLASIIPNYGMVIIIFSILLKLVLYPLTKTSYKSMARMRELQPQMEALKAKYGDNPQKQQEEMMKMYKQTGVNPLGGCLPMLLQYPIIIALWQYLPSSIEIRQQGFLWANDLSAPDVILNLPFNIPLYGDFVAGFTLLMGISMVVQMKIQMTPTAGMQGKIFTYVFPVMIFAIFNRLASGLSLYYLIYNVVTAIQQQWINKHIEKTKDAGTDGKGKKGDVKGVSKAKKAKLKP
jgi:YidC/Oxa1 family membrane protein insertase